MAHAADRTISVIAEGATIHAMTPATLLAIVGVQYRVIKTTRATDERESLKGRNAKAIYV